MNFKEWSNNNANEIAYQFSLFTITLFLEILLVIFLGLAIGLTYFIATRIATWRLHELGY